MKRAIATIFLILFFLGTFLPASVFADEVCEEEIDIAAFLNAYVDVAKIKPPIIEAHSAIVMDMKSGRVLFEKDAHTRRPMASTTKIMTAIIAIEKGNLDDIVTVSKRATSVWGSTINLKEGEKLTLRELLYGLMLESGNDAAIAIGEHIGGTLENFIDMMNAKAKALGAINTSFKTPHGLDTPGHYTTAYDLSLITRYALANPTFSEIVGTVSTSISRRTLHNTNEMLNLYPGADGVKTGYTGQAGRCLVTSATRDGMRLISVVLNCSSRTKRAESTKKILDYAFANYKPYILLEEGKQMALIPVKKGRSKQIAVKALNEISLPLKIDEYERIQKEVTLPDILRPPVFANIEVGEVKFLLDGKVIASTPIITAEDSPAKTMKDYLGEIFLDWGRMFREGMFEF